MRKVGASPSVSPDSLIALPDGASDWPTTSSERFAREILPMLLEQSDTIVQFWPSMSPKEERFATPMNTLPKIVFSQSLKEVTWGKWQNATLVKDDPAEAIAKLKQQAGKNPLIAGQWEADFYPGKCGVRQGA